MFWYFANVISEPRSKTSSQKVEGRCSPVDSNFSLLLDPVTFASTFIVFMFDSSEDENVLLVAILTYQQSMWNVVQVCRRPVLKQARRNNCLISGVNRCSEISQGPPFSWNFKEDEVAFKRLGWKISSALGMLHKFSSWGHCYAIPPKTYER